MDLKLLMPRMSGKRDANLDYAAASIVRAKLAGGSFTVEGSHRDMKEVVKRANRLLALVRNITT